MHGSLLLLPILCPFLGALTTAPIHTPRRRRLAVSVTLILHFLLLLPLLFLDLPALTVLNLVPGVRIVFQADALGKLFILLISLIWFFVALFAFEYMGHESHPGRFYAFYLITLSALTGICFAGNLVTLYLFYEMMTLCSVPLVLHLGTKQAFDAAWRYLAYSVAGAALGLLGLFFLQDFCTTDLFTPGGVLNPAMAAENQTLLLVVFLIMAVGFGCKAGMFPLHAWLPIAHPEAPAPASAVLSGLITKMGILALFRVIYFLFGWEFLAGTWAQTAVLTLALITILMGSALALWEDTLKKRLAYSTVSQVSYIIFGLMLLNPAAMEGALLQVVFHALAKNILFLAVGAIIYKTHLTHASQMRGVGVVFHITMWCFTLSALSLVGIPPTGGFVSKWMLAQGALESAGVPGYVGIGILMTSALLTAGYLLSIVTRAFFPGQGFDNRVIHRQQKTPLMRFALCVLTAISLILGMFPNIIAPALDAIVRPLF